MNSDPSFNSEVSRASRKQKDLSESNNETSSSSLTSDIIALDVHMQKTLRESSVYKKISLHTKRTIRSISLDPSIASRDLKIKDLQAQIRGLESTNVELNSTLLDLEQKVGSQRNTIKDLENNSASSKKFTDSKMNETQAQIRALEIINIELSTNQLDLEHDLGRKKAAIKDLEYLISKKDERITFLELNIEGEKDVVIDMDMLRENASLRQDMERLKSKLNSEMGTEFSTWVKCLRPPTPKHIVVKDEVDRLLGIKQHPLVSNL